MTQDGGKLKRQFMNLLRGSREQAVEVAEEIRESATRLRERLDEEKSQRERKRLLANLGKAMYALYQEGTWTPPESVEKLIEELDALPDPYSASEPTRDDALERLADTADSVIRGVASGVGAWLSDPDDRSDSSPEAKDETPGKEPPATQPKPKTRKKAAPRTKKPDAPTPKTAKKTSRNTVLAQDPLENLKDDSES